MYNGIKYLREVCDELKVSRRAIQGYEKAGLVSPTDRNKYGHLLYDDKAQKRIETIKLYQQLGFSIKEITQLIDAPQPVIKQALKKQVVYLKGEKERIDLLIERAYELMEMM